MNNSFSKILDKIRDYDKIVILRHQNPDPDALGSQCGLREILRYNFPDKTVLATGYNEPSLQYLATMDEFDENVAEALIIVCDTANRPRIDSRFWREADFLIKIDHHPNDDVYGDLYYVDDKASSVSEIITEFAVTMNLEIPSSAARLLYGGIVGDTGRFLYPSTSPKTLALAAKLAEKDFDRSELGQTMNSFDMKVARLQGYIYENLVISANGAACVTITQDLLREMNLKDSETSSIVSLPGNIRNIKLWAIFVEQPDGHYRVRMRSKFTPINEIAKRHDGGGHVLASGANAYSFEELEEIWQELQDVLR
ncbi:DHH family phosphoesterase [Lactovum miscens]|uniref:Phosphoesterase RecJ-like protein n=1 Tax=Lactovum miscens TaxID=190387 RepID=A0A841CB42_9LACT|nr:bifunctional oligoribonuclease/PAP phosphatase NrnA [Lactovum miscens]MBB5888772.1 phosphoesterase RecJ-like protein [Lactovum miscens]